jgi:hypothetical protein
MNQTINIRTEDGEFSAYRAKPAATPAPVVIVLHELFGVNEDIRLTCQEMAAQGFGKIIMAQPSPLLAPCTANDVVVATEAAPGRNPLYV